MAYLPFSFQCEIDRAALRLEGARRHLFLMSPGEGLYVIERWQALRHWQHGTWADQADTALLR